MPWPLYGAFWFPYEINRRKRIEVDWLDKARKKDLIENKLERDNDQALTSKDDSDRLTLFRMSLSRSLIFELMRFCQKLNIRVKGENGLKIDEIGEFWIEETL